MSYRVSMVEPTTSSMLHSLFIACPHAANCACRYVIIYWGDNVVGKTHVLMNDVNPVWNQTIEVGPRR